jgi:hypothetical protein
MVASLLIILIRVLSFRLDGLTGKLPDIGWREACGARLLARLGLASEPLLGLAGSVRGFLAGTVKKKLGFPHRFSESGRPVRRFRCGFALYVIRARTRRKNATCLR